MFKRLNVFLLVMVLSVVSLIASPGSDNESILKEINELKEKITALENRLQSQQVEAAETDRLSSSNSLEGDSKMTIESDPDVSWGQSGFAVLKDTFSNVSIGGNVDVLGWYLDNNTVTPAASREDNSDVLIDQVRLNVGVEVNDFVNGLVAFQFEDYQTGSFAGGGGDTEDVPDGLQLDEAYVAIGGDEGVYGRFGKQYFAFGNYEEYGNFINDTLTRQLYETRDTGATVGYQSLGMNLEVFTFNGQANQVRSGGADNKIDAWGGSLSYAMAEEDRSIKLGVSYINNILQAQNTNARAGLGGVATYNDNDSTAWNAYAVASMGPFWISGEYAAAINELDPADVPGGVRAQRPEAFTLEAAVTTPFGDRDYTLAVKWEENNDQVVFGNSLQSVFGVGVSSNVLENTRLTLNYENWHYENINQGGSGGSANLGLAELSISF